MSINTQDYLFLGAIRCVAAFPLEHPLEVAKVKCQGMPAIAPSKVVQTLYRENGVKGFFDGGLSNLSKRTMRIAYRWPTVAALHSFWDTTIPQCKQFNGLTSHLMTAGSIAAIETAIVLPLDRLFVSRVHDLGYRHFVKNQFKNEGIKSLYHGAGATFINHGTSWSTFMLVNHFSKKAISKMDPESRYPSLDKTAKIAMISTSLCAVDLPFEFMKLQRQMHPHFQKNTLLQMTKDLFKQHGVKGFYSGLSFAFMHKSVQTLFGTAFFEQMEVK